MMHLKRIASRNFT